VITTEDYTCWRIVLASGEDHDMGDGVQHYRHEQDARNAIDDHPGATAQAFAQPCVTVACDGCELDFENDVFTLHFEDGVEQARKVARESDWTVTEDGRMYCWDCPVPDAEEDADLAAEAAR
jgi:hypothetical protein